MTVGCSLDVLLHQVGVEGDRGRVAGVGRGDDLGARVDEVAGGPDAGDAGPSRDIGADEAALVGVAPERAGQAVGSRDVARPDEDRGPGDAPAVGQLDPGQPVGLDDESGHLCVHDLDATGPEPVPFTGGQRVGVGEEDHVVGPLAEQERMLDRAGLGAQDGDRLVADLPAVAVRAVQQVPAPPLVGTGDVASCSLHHPDHHTW